MLRPDTGESVVPANTLYYGDNLDILRRHIKDESVDLIYLDPPFNSQATYNVLFRSPTGEHSKAQIEAFDDTWHWNESASRAFDDVMTSGNTDAADILRAMQSVLGNNDMMAYLTMMAVRLLELYRALKPTGSLYLHCDPTASHYLKILLDAIFGVTQFRTEIIWKRKSGRGETNSKTNRFGQQHDAILFYGKTAENYFNPQFNIDASESYIEERFKHVDEDGRRYRKSPMLSPTLRPNLIYEYKGYKSPEKGWAVSRELMAQMDNEGRLIFPKNKARRIERKQYLDEYKGTPVQSIWSDIPFINPMAQERLGYPTQKPVGLLARIIAASSLQGDVVLDPFCGCGTTLDAAQKLERQWIGIDVTHLAVGLIERRLSQRYPGAKFQVIGTPGDLEAARDVFARSPHEFQLWAGARIAAQPYKGGKKGADTGIDGVIYFKPDGKTTEKAIVYVKGGTNVSVPMIRDLGHVVDREGAKLGIFITLAEPTAPMKREAAGAGLYEVPGWRKVPKLQILTIADLFDRRQPDIPARDASEFKRSETADTSAAKQPKLI
jgi:site-specific DNA-methyltransferase (adenine-specific)